MSNNSDTPFSFGENSSDSQGAFFHNLKTRFCSLPYKVRFILIVFVAIILWFFFTLFSSTFGADPITIVKDSYLSGYPNATMGEIMEVGQITIWRNERSDNGSNLYLVWASNGTMTFYFSVDVREKSWQLDSFISSGSLLTGPTMNMVVGNLLDSWYAVAQYQ